MDQAEEVFTLCEHAAARQAFFDNLHFAATLAGGQTMVILTVRADFLGKFAPYPALAAALTDHDFLVGPMTETELASAIERPAALAGGEFEQGLVAMLLKDIDGQAGSLPLLQFTLMQLWGRLEGRRMTVASYKAIGGLQGALKNQANQVLEGFSETQRALCERIFLRLTQPGEGNEDTKRRAAFAELVPAGADPSVVAAVVRRLADARLITTTGADSGSVEVAHEALIKGWGQLREWIEKDREGLRLRGRLSEAAREWEAHNREKSFLYEGTRLTLAQEWEKTHHHELNELEAAFFAASRSKRRGKKIARIAVVAAALALAVGTREWLLKLDRDRFESISQKIENALEDADKEALAANLEGAIEELKGSKRFIESGVEYSDFALESRIKASEIRRELMRSRSRRTKRGRPRRRTPASSWLSMTPGCSATPPRRGVFSRRKAKNSSGRLFASSASISRLFRRKTRCG